MLVLLQAEVAAADERDGQVVAAVIAAAHGAGEEDDGVVEDRRAVGFFDGVKRVASSFTLPAFQRVMLAKASTLPC